MVVDVEAVTAGDEFEVQSTDLYGTGLVVSSATTLSGTIVEPVLELVSFDCDSGVDIGEVQQAGNVLSCSVAYTHTGDSTSSGYTSTLVVSGNEHVSFDLDETWSRDVNVSGSASPPAMAVFGAANNSLEVLIDEVTVAETVVVDFTVRVLDSVPLGALLRKPSCWFVSSPNASTNCVSSDCTCAATRSSATASVYTMLLP